MFQIDESTRRKILEQEGTNDEKIKEDVEAIKEWSKTQPHLPEILADAKIRTFLLLSKCSIERAKQKIDMYHTIRSVIPDLFEDSNPKLPHMKKAMENTYFFIHPKLVEKTSRVYFLAAKEPDRFSPREVAMQCVNIEEVRIDEDSTINTIFVVDLKNFSANDLLKVTPSLTLKVLAVFEKVFSFRVKAIYFVNSPSYINKLMAMFKAVTKPKIFSRIQICENVEVLRRVFARQDLPEDYGGDGPSLQDLNEMMKLKLEEYQDRFDQLDKLRVDESLRPLTLKNDDLLGYYGNFKTLTVD